jgi:glycosyltransferase involved in cell wall biosynthesis
MGVDPPAQTPPAKRSTTRLRVLFVGRLEPIKGARTLLAALRACPDVEATLAGDGSERRDLGREAATLGGRARMLGHVPRDDVRRLYEEHDVLVVPSVVTTLGRSEGVPHVALEAQAHGLPVVASRVGGLAEVVHDDLDGLLVPPGDPAALASALTRLAHDRTLLATLAQRARENGERHAWPRVLARMGDGVW